MSKKILISIIAAAIILITGVVVVNQFSKRDSDDLPSNAPQEATEANGLSETFVALGSSLTKATNLSSDKQGDNEEYNFSTGDKIPSIYAFLKKNKSNLRAVNLASPGATMGDILRNQLSNALSYNPQYISLDPGADIVTKNSVKDFKSDLSEIIQQINPRTTILLFTYPNFVKMRAASYQSCRENKVGVSLENLTESNILAFNQAIKETVEGKQNVILLDIYNLLGPTELSDYDCLHINIKGQEKIAEGFIDILNSK